MERPRAKSKNTQIIDEGDTSTGYIIGQSTLPINFPDVSSSIVNSGNNSALLRGHQSVPTSREQSLSPSGSSSHKKAKKLHAELLTPKKRRIAQRGVVTMVQSNRRIEGKRTKRNFSAAKSSGSRKSSTTILERANLNQVNKAVNKYYDKSFEQKFFKFK